MLKILYVAEGKTHENKDALKKLGAKYSAEHKKWIFSTKPAPASLPKGVEVVEQVEVWPADDTPAYLNFGKELYPHQSVLSHADWFIFNDDGTCKFKQFPK